jgi:hypothetical protein
MRGIETLKKHGVEFNVLCVLSEANVGQPRELYRFFRGLGIEYIQYIPLAEFDGAGNPLPYTVSADQYGRFLCETFDLWWPERRKVRIRYFDNLAEAVAGRKPGACTLHETCDSYCVVEYNGDVYPCDFFVEKEARQYHAGRLAGDRPPPAPLLLRGEEDAGAPGVPGMRMAEPVSRRLPQAAARPPSAVRGPGLVLRRLQTDLRESRAAVEERSAEAACAGG